MLDDSCLLIRSPLSHAMFAGNARMALLAGQSLIRCCHARRTTHLAGVFIQVAVDLLPALIAPARHRELVSRISYGNVSNRCCVRSVYFRGFDLHGGCGRAERVEKWSVCGGRSSELALAALMPGRTCLVKMSVRTSYFADHF